MRWEILILLILTGSDSSFFTTLVISWTTTTSFREQNWSRDLTNARNISSTIKLLISQLINTCAKMIFALWIIKIYMDSIYFFIGDIEEARWQGANSTHEWHTNCAERFRVTAWYFSDMPWDYFHTSSDINFTQEKEKEKSILSHNS